MAGDPGLAALVARWEERLSPLADDSQSVAPPPDVWRRIDAATRPKNTGKSGQYTVREDAEAWTQLLPGIRIRLLHVDEARRMRTFLARLEPGARFSNHVHPADHDEELYVIEGEMSYDGVPVRAGEYHFVKGGVVHELTSPRAHSSICAHRSTSSEREVIMVSCGLADHAA
jgi:quercetin dioxygenase-like cupin family protein